MMAAKLGHTSIVKLLLSYGADPSLRDTSGLLALQMAQQGGHKLVEAILMDPELYKNAVSCPSPTNEELPSPPPSPVKEEERDPLRFTAELPAPEEGERGEEEEVGKEGEEGGEEEHQEKAAEYVLEGEEGQGAAEQVGEQGQQEVVGYEVEEQQQQEGQQHFSFNHYPSGGAATFELEGGGYDYSGIDGNQQQQPQDEQSEEAVKEGQASHEQQGHEDEGGEIKG